MKQLLEDIMGCDELRLAECILSIGQGVHSASPSQTAAV
jgi:hypothetical protein